MKSSIGLVELQDSGDQGIAQGTAHRRKAGVRDILDRPSREEVVQDMYRWLAKNYIHRYNTHLYRRFVTLCSNL
jgi:hypothetical protein